jgi:DNA-binding transcriptional MocR family regulator
MNVALHLPARLADKVVAARAVASGLHVLPLSRYASGAHARNGLLLGYAALTERQIAAGVARLAQVIARGD